jgi:hypothetical protein
VINLSYRCILVSLREFKTVPGMGVDPGRGSYVVQCTQRQQRPNREIQIDGNRELERNQRQTSFNN